MPWPRLCVCEVAGCAAEDAIVTMLDWEFDLVGDPGRILNEADVEGAGEGAAGGTDGGGNAGMAFVREGEACAVGVVSGVEAEGDGRAWVKTGVG